MIIERIIEEWKKANDNHPLKHHTESREYVLSKRELVRCRKNLHRAGILTEEIPSYARTPI